MWNSASMWTKSTFSIFFFHVIGRYEEEFIEHRMNQLQSFVDRVCHHPVLSQSEVWQHFLTCTDEKRWKSGKRKAEKDPLTGGTVFMTIRTPERPMDPDFVWVLHKQKCSRWKKASFFNIFSAIMKLKSFRHFRYLLIPLWKTCIRLRPTKRKSAKNITKWNFLISVKHFKCLVRPCNRTEIT